MQKVTLPRHLQLLVLTAQLTNSIGLTLTRRDQAERSCPLLTTPSTSSTPSNSILGSCISTYGLDVLDTLLRLDLQAYNDRVVRGPDTSRNVDFVGNRRECRAPEAVRKGLWRWQRRSVRMRRCHQSERLPESCGKKRSA